MKLFNSEWFLYQSPALCNATINAQKKFLVNSINNSLQLVKYSTVCTFALLLMLSSCKNKDLEIKIAAKNFTEEVEIQQNFNITFNRDLIPDSITDRWETGNVFHFTPSIEGKYKWVSTHEIMFSPTGPLDPCTEYKLELNTAPLLTHAKQNSYFDGDVIYTFHTAYLNFESANFHWTASENKTAVLNLQLGFNFPLNPSEVIKRIKVSSNGKDYPVTLAATEVASTIHFQISGVDNLDDDIPVKITIDKNLPVPHSAYITKSMMSYESIIPSKSKLIINEVTADHNGTEGVIMIKTSEEINETSIKNAVTFNPSIEYSAMKTDFGFTISSKQFDINNAYRITISTLLEGAIGGKLKEAFAQEIVFGKIKPSIKFNNQKGLYLGSRGNRNLAVSIVSIPKIKISLYKIYENNIIQFFRQGYQYGDHYSYDSENEDGDGYYSDYNYYDTDDFGDLIWEQEVETRKLEKQDASRLYNLNFDDKIKDQHGIYVVQIASSDQSWVQASKVIALSDIGMIVKESEKSIMIFVNSIKDTRSIPAVRLNLISNKNQLIKSLVTNNDGIAVYDKPENVFPAQRVQMITSVLEDDYNFVRLDGNNMTETSRFDVGGKYLNNLKYDSFLYGDRDIYRPGETIYLTGIIRDLSWNIPGEVPVQLKLYLPNGRIYKTIRKILNKSGSFEASVSLPAGIVTGTYRATVSTGDDVILTSKSISVEEFMPDKISVKAELNKEKTIPGDTIRTNITATNLFGPPASGRNYTMEMSLSQDYFYSKTFNEYNFNTSNRNNNFNVVERSGQTDEMGNIKEAFYLDKNQYYNMGLLQGKIFTTVFDESGRPVNRENYFKFFTQNVFTGLKYSDTYVSLKTPVTFGVAAVDANDKPLNNVKATIQIIKREWQTVLEKVGNRFQYNSQLREKPITAQELVINQKTSYSFTPVLSGEYVVRLYPAGSNNYVEQYFYAYGYGSTENTSFEVNNEGTVEIQLDKKEYNTGDVAHLLFKTPFVGKIIATIEQDKVLKYYLINTDKKSAALDVYLKDEHVPNIFVSATLIRPSDDGSNPLIVAHGYSNIKVSNPANKLNVRIDAPLNSRSKTKQVIRIRTAPFTQVTVAVVDEGILQLKNFQTPDPYSYFYQPRALTIGSYDIYPYLFPEILAKKNYTGGGGYDLAKRVNPLSNKRVQLVALWSGILNTDGSGLVEYPVNIPQFNGDLRIMAVAYKENKFGSSDAHIKVADPIVINAGLPRFTSPRDTVYMPVTISNTTKNNASAKVTLSVTGPFNVATDYSKSITIKSNSESKVDFKITAQQNIGTGKITVAVNALNENFTDVTEMSVRPTTSLQKISGNGDIIAGQSKTVDVSGKFIPSTVATQLVVSRSPVIQFADNLEYLIRYPYGCVEQTTSAAFPQLYFYDLAKTVMKKQNNDPNPNYNVQQAIAKLQSMLMSNGALSYWPGAGEESWFGSVYAAHFLWEAKKAGFEVDQDVLNKIHGYIINKLKQHNTFVYRYNGTMSKEIAPKEIPYSMFVLALANKPQISEMNYYKANNNLVSLDGKYLLAAAYALSGNKLNYEQMLPHAFDGEISVGVTGGSFYSYIRDEAISLNALLEVDPNNPQISIMARHLSQQLKGDRYLNTQENVFSLLALGKIARMNAKSNATGTVMVGGKALASVNEKEAILKINDLKGQKVDITSSGNGKLFYYYVTEGLSADGSFKQEDNFMRVRKTFYNKHGQQINALNFKQNDLVVIKISIAGLTNNLIENVVITDMLPAGFEIENPRIGSMPDCAWIRNESTPDHQDIRDDRINLFTDVSSAPRDYYYMVRCVTRGVYQMGPVQADAMYNGEYHSYNGGGVVKIQ